MRPSGSRDVVLGLLLSRRSRASGPARSSRCAAGNRCQLAKTVCSTNAPRSVIELVCYAAPNAHGRASGPQASHPGPRDTASVRRASAETPGTGPCGTAIRCPGFMTRRRGPSSHCTHMLPGRTRAPRLLSAVASRRSGQPFFHARSIRWSAFDLVVGPGPPSARSTRCQPRLRSGESQAAFDAFGATLILGRGRCLEPPLGYRSWPQSSSQAQSRSWGGWRAWWRRGADGDCVCEGERRAAGAGLEGDVNRDMVASGARQPGQ